MTVPDSGSEPLPDLLAPLAAGGSPLHGYQGNRARPAAGAPLPAGLSIAVSRESGARGGTIARRVGKKLGWQVFQQELLDYIAQEATFQQGDLGLTAPEARRWADDQLQALQASGQLTGGPDVLQLARTILTLATQGEAILLGRGAGCLLPRPSTLNVRIIAPHHERVAYMAQWLRRTREEAAEQVRQRDRSRAEFIETHFRRQASDPYQYDLVLNSTLLGEDLCVDLIVQAARAKEAMRASQGG